MRGHTTVNLTKKPLPIGINLPIQRGKAGYFDLNYDTISQTKSNITNLLNTVRGERRFQPLFGTGLQNALFEQNLTDTPDVLKQIIINDITMWMPSVTVNDVNLTVQNATNTSEVNTYIVHIKIIFTVNNTQDSVNLVIQQNSI